jgi:hypothetical protein
MKKMILMALIGLTLWGAAAAYDKVRTLTASMAAASVMVR